MINLRSSLLPLLAASLLPAQTPNPAAVRLNVGAYNSSGEPLKDLKAADFQITDQGKAQKIALFRGLSTPLDAVPLAAHEISNRTGARPHAVAIVFDLLNENQMDRLDVWHKLGKSLGQLESGDGVYFYLLTLEGTLAAIHPMGSKAGDDHTWPQGVEKVLDKAMKAASHARPTEMGDPEMVAKKTYVALETLGNQLAMYPGRRDIVWITNGMPNVWNPKTPCNGDWVDCALYVPHLAVTLDLTNVAVDPLSYTSSPSPDMRRDLDQLSGLTGGWTYFGEDIRAVLKHVATESDSQYTLHYEPPADNWDSKFHHVHVACERAAGKLHTRDRYYAYPDSKPEAKARAALVAAYQSSVDDPTIGLRASLTPSADGKSAHIQLKIDPSDLMLREENGHFSGSVTMVIGKFSASGPVGDPGLMNFNLSFTKEEFEKAVKEGVASPQDQAIDPSIQKLRVIVLDPNSVAVGSLTLPLNGK